MSSAEESGFRLVDVHHVADTSFLKIELLEMVSPTGRTMERTVVRHPGAVAVVAIDGSDVVLIRQYRAAVDRPVLEIPAGKLDVPGEDLEQAARRELEEEVGLQAQSVRLLTTFWTTPGFSDERMWVYLATGLKAVGSRPHGAEEEVAEVVRVGVADIPAMLAADVFEDAKTIIGLAAMVAERT